MDNLLSMDVLVGLYDLHEDFNNFFLRKSHGMWFDVICESSSLEEFHDKVDKMFFYYYVQ